MRCPYFAKYFTRDIFPPLSMPENKDQESVGRGYGAGYQIVAAGFGLAFSILFFVWVGYLADKALHTAPLFLLIGLAIGLGAGFYAFWLKISAASKDKS